MGEFRMPCLGADMESGTVLEWRVGPGDTVRWGDIVAVVETDKSTIDVEVFENGVVDEILVAPGDEVPVGGVLANIRPQGIRAPRATPVEGNGFVRASPRARRLAAETGLDLRTVHASGQDGAVLAADVTRQRGGPPGPPPGPGLSAAALPPAPRRSQRDAVGALMARSKREIPHYYLASTLDMSTALSWMTEANLERPVAERLLPVDLLLRATALAARDGTTMNGHWRDKGYQPAEHVHLGVAVAVRGGGVLAPALADADRMPLDALSAALRDLVRRSRAGRLRSSQTVEPTITVTSLGDLGVDEAFGVLYPPQVAIVGFGRIREAAWAANGTLTARPVVTASLAADHRASTGHEGARFLATIDRLLQHPDRLPRGDP